MRRDERPGHRAFMKPHPYHRKLLRAVRRELPKGGKATIDRTVGRNSHPRLILEVNGLRHEQIVALTPRTDCIGRAMNMARKAIAMMKAGEQPTRRIDQ